MKYPFIGTKRSLELRYAPTDTEKRKPFLLMPAGEANVYRILCGARLEGGKLYLKVKTWNDVPEYSSLQPVEIVTSEQIEFSRACLEAVDKSTA